MDEIDNAVKMLRDTHPTILFAAISGLETMGIRRPQDHILIFFVADRLDQAYIKASDHVVCRGMTVTSLKHDLASRDTWVQIGLRSPKILFWKDDSFNPASYMLRFEESVWKVPLVKGEYNLPRLVECIYGLLMSSLEYATCIHTAFPFKELISMRLRDPMQKERVEMLLAAFAANRKTIMAFPWIKSFYVA